MPKCRVPTGIPCINNGNRGGVSRRQPLNIYLQISRPATEKKTILNYRLLHQGSYLPMSSWCSAKACDHHWTQLSGRFLDCREVTRCAIASMTDATGKADCTWQWGRRTWMATVALVILGPVRDFHRNWVHASTYLTSVVKWGALALVWISFLHNIYSHLELASFPLTFSR